MRVDERYPKAVPTNRIAIVVGVRDDGQPATPIPAAAADAFTAILAELAATCPHTPLVVLACPATRAGRLALDRAAERDLATVACLPAARDAYLGAFAGDEAERGDIAATIERCGRIDVAMPGEEDAYVASFGDVLVTFAAGEARARSLEAALADDAARYRIDFSSDSDTPARVSTSFPARFSGDDLARDVAAAYARIDQYNADLERAQAGDRGVATIDDLCESTSEIASRLQRVTFRYLFVLYGIALVATAAQYTTSQIFKYAMLPVAFVTYRIAKRFDYENRYQDYRALAEGLRVQAAWFESGLDEEQSHRSYLGMQERELHWIRMALRYAHFAFRPARGTEERGPAGSRSWVMGQLAYFAASARREQRRLAEMGRLSRSAFWFALVAATAIVAVLNVPFAPAHLGELAWWGAAHLRAFPGLSAWLASISVADASLERSWIASAAWSTGWSGSLRAWSLAPGPHGWLVRPRPGCSRSTPRSRS